MAELRRLNGDMEPMRRPAGRRVLLPVEVELCNAVGITEDEYFYFVDLTQSYNGQRSAEYDAIPDIKNDAATTIAIVSLVIGIASSAVSILMAPKPRSPQQQKTPPSLRTSDVVGQSRFAPQVGFDAVQDLATLGSIIPLVFTRKGVRVSSQLLWSQMLSYGTYQQLKGVFLFSSGEIEQRPDFAGYAIGDSTLENYTEAKLALYFKSNGNRILENQFIRYTEGSLAPAATDAFSVYWDNSNRDETYFCGTRTPSTQTQFGVYSPMANGMRYRPNYELILIPKDTATTVKNDTDKKKDKIYNANFPRLAAITGYDGLTLTYRLDGATIEQVTGDSYEPWGVEDVRAAVDSGRTEADDAISVGEQYLAGSALVVATTVPTKPWSTGYWKDFKFKVVEPGQVDTVSTSNLNLADPSYTKSVLQRVAIATVSNSRACNMTEIGIKSTVWRQITGFANVNSHPGDDTVREYEENNGSMALGTIQKYIKRLSFFTLQVRTLGSNGPWKDISAGRPFCIRGRTPQAQYNFVRITHEYGQYEFRFMPAAGNYVQKKLEEWWGGYVWLLRSDGDLYPLQTAGAFKIRFKGEKLRLSRNEMCNTEWIVGKVPADDGNASYLENNTNRNDAISDFVTYDAERSSHMDGPEHEITYVNEVVVNDHIPIYDKLAIAGLRINSSKEWANFSQLSAYFKKGVAVNRLINGQREATNLFPEIAYALLTDGTVGAGSLIGAEQVDSVRMTTAAKFCNANNFLWDGVISERQNLREFIYEQAAYCLLDFSIMGGRFSLYPSVPFTPSGAINASGKPEIKAMFTDGNIRSMQVSFLSPEERQLFQAVCLWRQDTENGFPETRTYKARFSAASSGSEADPVETFDMSGFCTSEAHARSFALFALKTRKEIDHGVKFETTPQSAMALMPGEYFRLVSEATHTTRFKNGSVSADGTIVSLDLPNGTIAVYYWQPGTTEVREGNLTVSNGRTNQSAFYGTVFTVKTTAQTDRVYKVESLTYAEDGLVEIAGSYVPLTSSGTLEVLNWSGSQFVEEFE